MYSVLQGPAFWDAARPTEEPDLNRKTTKALGVCLAGGALFYFAASAQTSRRSPAITRAVDESRLASLAGNVRPEANAENDRGMVDDHLPLDHLLLQLKRSAATEA